MSELSETSAKLGQTTSSGDLASQEKNGGDVNTEPVGGAGKLTMGEDGKPTIGEELFLVHLSRHKGETPSEDDFDRESPRKRLKSESIGEELWNVHVRRNMGMELDIDEEVSGQNRKGTGAKPRKTRASDKVSKPARCSERLAKTVLHLRTRDVQKTMIQ